MGGRRGIVDVSAGSKHLEPKTLIITIHEEGHPRRESSRKELGNIGIDGNFVCGLTPADREVSDLYWPLGNAIFSKRSLTPQEVAAYASHRRAWREFLASDRPFALILEDDFHAPEPERLRAAIADCVRNAERWDVVKFFEFSRKRVWRRRQLDATSLVAFKYQSAGAVGYLLSRDAATRLLARKRVFRPVDEDMSWSWEFDLRVWTTDVDLVRDVSHTLGGSQIEASRLHMKRRRNVVRSVWGNAIQAWKFSRAVVHHLQGALERG